MGSGIGRITIIDNDTVSESNLNRQIIATVAQVGKDKVTVAKERLLSINPEIAVKTEKTFVLPENIETFNLAEYDYVIDAVDTVSAKIALAVFAEKAGVPIISCMGTGGKLDPTMLKVSDIYKTSGCPLARVMRKELKTRGVKKLKVVYSEESSLIDKTQAETAERKESGRISPPSMIFVPAAAGLIIAAEVIKDIIRVSGD